MNMRVFYDYLNILSSEKKDSRVRQVMMLRSRKELQQESKRILYFTFCLVHTLDTAFEGKGERETLLTSLPWSLDTCNGSEVHSPVFDVCLKITMIFLPYEVDNGYFFLSF